MPRGSDQEKTEPATPKRLQEMREKGQVAKSREVPSIAVLIVSLLIFYFLGSVMIKEYMELMKWTFKSSVSLQIEEASIRWFLVECLQRCWKILAPMVPPKVAIPISKSMFRFSVFVDVANN